MDTITALVTSERTARIAMATFMAPDDPVTGRLLGDVGAVETVRLLTTDGPMPGMGKEAAALWRKHLPAASSAEAALAALRATEKLGYRTVIPGDEGFPASLRDLGERMPYVLWIKGAASLLAGHVQDRFTITGARAFTSYGTHVAQAFASDLSSEEKVLISGGAYGIDAAVHTATLASGGHTIAVLASGLDRPHPAGHRELLERIGDLGLLVSELPPGTEPTRTRFLARARVEAALSGSSTIVEAAGRSGALPVAQCAHELGRPVGAVPGPVTSVASLGTHRLLQMGVASLVTDASDLMRLVESAPAAEKLERDQLTVGRGRQAPSQRVAPRDL